MSNSQKIALMICYYYPPIHASGTTRSLEFSKLLTEFNWHPKVLTVKDSKDAWVNTKAAPVPEGIEIIRTNEFNLMGLTRFCFGAINKLVGIFGFQFKKNFLMELLCVPDSQIAWRFLLRGRKEAKAADLIYVSCSPFSVSISAALIKILTGKPLVVDFRDAWSMNPYTSFGTIRGKVEKCFEKFVLSQADHLVVNTPGTEKLYRTAYPEFTEKISCIPNGFDRLTPAEQERSPGPFKIVHTGSFYGSRSPKNLLDALADLNNPNIQFVQIGGEFAELKDYQDRVNIDCKGLLPKEQALEHCRQADLLYLRQGHEPGVSDYVAVGAKTYDYLATGLPILSECPDGDNTDLVQEHAPKSWIITSEGDSAAILKAVQEAYELREKREVRISEAFKSQFDRKNLAKSLTNIFSALSPR